MSVDHAVALAIGTCWATLVVAAVGLPSAARHQHLRPPATSAPRATTPTRATWITHLGATIRRHVTRWQPPAPTPSDSRADSRPAGPPAPVAALNPHELVPEGHPREATIRPDRDTSWPSYTRPDAPHDTDHAATDRADRRTGWAALAGLTLLPVAPTLAPVPLASALALPALSARADRRRHETALVDQLPDVVDLLALTTAAGLPVSGAITAIADRPGGPLGGALFRASAHIRHGGTLADALALVATTGPPVRPLADALAHHDRYGSPLVPALERVGIEARARRRRHAEEAARRLPVTLLFPLVLTTFPAFVVLTVVPLLAGSLGSLSP